jgi:hypothetical protein
MDMDINGDTNNWYGWTLAWDMDYDIDMDMDMNGDTNNW